MNINEIDVNTLYKQSKPVQFVLAGICAVLIVVLGYFLAFSDQIDEYKAATEKEEQLKDTFTQKSGLAANLKNLKEELVLIEESIGVLLKQLPTDAQIPNLIQEMHQAAAKNGLVMTDVTTQNVVNEGAIQRLPFTISVTGTHDQIANFARDIGRVSRIVTLSNLSIKNTDNKGDKLTLSALANTYKAADAQDVSEGSPAAAN